MNRIFKRLLVGIVVSIVQDLLIELLTKVVSDVFARRQANLKVYIEKNKSQMSHSKLLITKTKIEVLRELAFLSDTEIRKGVGRIDEITKGYL